MFEKVASKCYKVLKKDKFNAIIVVDTYKNGMVQPIGLKLCKIYKCRIQTKRNNYKGTTQLQSYRLLEKLIAKI